MLQPYCPINQHVAVLRPLAWACADLLLTLQANLSIDDKDRGKAVAPSTQSPARRPVPRPENVPPGARRGPPPGHRSRPSGPPGPNSPPRRAPSGAGRPRGPERPMTEEEKKKRRDYERKKALGQTKKVVKAHRDRDLIDKLDETNPFGSSLGTFPRFNLIAQMPLLKPASPPLRSLRRRQPLPQQGHQQARPYVCLPQGLCEYVNGRLWTPEQAPRSRHLHGQ